jgi:hypothetical protein
VPTQYLAAKEAVIRENDLCGGVHRLKVSRLTGLDIGRAIALAKYFVDNGWAVLVQSPPPSPVLSPIIAATPDSKPRKHRHHTSGSGAKRTPDQPK